MKSLPAMSAPKRIWQAFYRLEAKARLNSKSEHRFIEGVLLKVEFDNGAVGYGSLQSWPSLGDPGLETLLACLQEGLWSREPLIIQALESASADAFFRSRGESAFKELAVPESHATIPFLSDELIEAAVNAGFKAVKIKVGRDLTKEAEWIRKVAKAYPELCFRFDLNFSQERSTVLSWWESLGEEVKLRVDWVEDPFVGFEKEESLPFNAAWDRGGELEYLSHGNTAFVWKPAMTASDEVLRFLKSGKFTSWLATSYMDHPIGQSYAAYQAARLHQELGSPLLCGLVTQNCFEMNAYAEQLGSWSPKFCPASGQGWGFDGLLEKESWQLIYQH